MRAAAPAGPTARKLAWLALAGQVAFVAAWVVAGALEPGYSHLHQTFSELGARDAANPGLVNAAYLVLGISFAAVGAALPTVLPRRPATRLAAGLFGLAGAAVVAVAFLPLDCALASDERCRDAFEAGRLSWETTAHVWAGLAFDVAFLLTPFAVARALWPRHAAMPALALAATAIPILAFALAAGAIFDGGHGLAQRLGFLAVHAWVAIVAVGVLHATRDAPAPGPLLPVRPRDFFGRAWTGRGELSLWPAWRLRRAGRGFHLRRDVTWVSDDVWLVRDTLRFDDGEVEEHDMVARLAGPDRVHVSGDDVPGGVDMLLDEGGYRMAPYRFAVPVGPLRFHLSPRDEVRHTDEEGALEWIIHFRWHGFPVARVRGVVRPTGEAPGAP